MTDKKDVLVTEDQNVSGQYIVNGVIIAGASSKEEALVIYEEGQNAPADE